MNVNTNNKSSLFLIELIIVILFFAIASAICASLFVQSRLISMESTELTMATQKCQNAAEALVASGGDAGQAAQLLDTNVYEEGLVTQLYDLDGNIDPNGRYQLQLTYSPDATLPDLIRATITMTDTDDEQVVCTLETASYHP